MRYAISLVNLVVVCLLFTACAPLPEKHEVGYSLPTTVLSTYHRVYDYYHIPAALDTQGTAAQHTPEGKMLVGYTNNWQESGIGNVNHRYLGFAYRGFVFFNRDLLPSKGLVLEAKLHFKSPSTEKWLGSSASNTGSAASKLYLLTAPYSGFSSSGDFYADLPNSTGVIANAEYDPVGGLVVNVTTPVNRILNGFDENHGFMLVGTNESYQRNNDRFLSTYEAPVLELRILEDKPQWPTP